MGELHVKIVEAAELVGVDHGSCSPYCSVRCLCPLEPFNPLQPMPAETLGQFKEETGTTERTKTQKNTTEPKWNQDFKIPAHDFCSVIYFKVWSKHHFSENKLLGIASLVACNLGTNTKSMWLNLEPLKTDKRQVTQLGGKIHIEIEFHPSPVSETKSMLVQYSQLVVVMWKIDYHFVDLQLFVKQWNKTTWSHNIEALFMDSITKTRISFEELNQTIFTQAPEMKERIMPRQAFQEVGAVLDNFTLIAALAMPPYVTLVSVENMKRLWLMRCFQNSYGGLVRHVNAFEFFLDSLLPVSTLYAEKTQGLVQIKTSKEICSSGNMYVETASSPYGGLIQIKTFSQIVQGM